MPGAARFRDKLEDAPVLLHQIVGAHPRRRIAEPPERGLPRGHAGVVQQQDVDRLAVRPGVVVGRGALDDLETGHAAPASSSSAITSSAFLTRANSVFSVVRWTRCSNSASTVPTSGARWSKVAQASATTTISKPRLVPPRTRVHTHMSGVLPRVHHRPMPR